MTAVRRTDAHGLVGELDRQRFTVGLGVGQDAADPEFLTGADDAERDFAPISDKDAAQLLRHRA